MAITATATIKLKTCEEHENTIVVFSGDWCPLCAALDDVKDLEEAINEKESDISTPGATPAEEETDPCLLNT